jgi:hypothetical protein
LIYFLRIGLFGGGRGLRHDGRALLAAYVADEQRLLVLVRVGLLSRNVALGGALLWRRLHHRRLALLRYQLRRHRPRLERRLSSRYDLRYYKNLIPAYLQIF